MGRGAWAGKGEDSEAGQSQGNQGFGITERAAVPCSPVPVPASPPLCCPPRSRPLTHQTEWGGGRGALTAAATPKPPTGHCGLRTTDNRKRLPRRLTPSITSAGRPTPPWPAEPIEGRGGTSGRGQRSRTPQGSQPGSRDMNWETRGPCIPVGRREATPQTPGGVRSHCLPLTGSASDEVLASGFLTLSGRSTICVELGPTHGLLQRRLPTCKMGPTPTPFLPPPGHQRSPVGRAQAQLRASLLLSGKM